MKIRLYEKKIKLAILLPAIAVLLIIGLFAVHIIRVYGNDAVVFEINNEKVSKAEFLSVMSDLRSGVFSYFSEKYGTEDSTKFWVTPVGGEVPVEVLRERTLEKLKKIKTEQILMKNMGLVKDISYNYFLEELKKQNKSRKAAVENNKPIYGPVQYDKSFYYDYLHSDRVEKLKEKLQEEGRIKADDMEIQKVADERFSGEKQQAKDEVINKKYEELIGQLINKANIKVNVGIYKGLYV